MKHIAHTPFLAIAYGWMALAATSAPAQTCSAPTEIVTAGFWEDQDTCNNTRNLPYLANGAMLNNGEDDVYHIAIGSSFTNQGYVTLWQTGDADLSLFVCRGPCGTYSTCVAAADATAGTPVTAVIPATGGDYYIIVGHASSSAPTCGSYTLAVLFPFPD